MKLSRSEQITPRRLPEEILELRDHYVVAGGKPKSAIVEHATDPRKRDHVWITIYAGKFGKVRIALSTMSKKSLNAGFDSRVRVGIRKSKWTELPVAGIHRSSGMNYARVEAEERIEFVVFERIDLENLLVEKARRAVFVEARAELYVRAHIGVHQIHSRRASFALSTDVIDRDGAVCFYFSPNEMELLFFKFAGQP